MTGAAFLVLFVVLVVLHLLTALLTVRYIFRGGSSLSAAPVPLGEPISVISAIARLDKSETESALSALKLASPTLEVLYCAFEQGEVVETVVREELNLRKNVNARLLIGRRRTSQNPKMDNIDKGHDAAKEDLLVFIDGNLMVPDDLVELLLAAWIPGVGAVSAVPLAVGPGNFWAEMECAFLNSFQARWQIASAELGSAFVQGKLFMMRKSWLDAQGGMDALRRELAEDTALTRLVHEAGLKVALVARPLDLPIGTRRFADVLNRQMRWSLLRRKALPVLNFLEVLGGLPALVTVGALAMSLLGLSPWPLVILTVGLWYTLDAAVALLCGWHWRPTMLPATFVRDCLSLPVWLSGWLRQATGGAIRPSRPALDRGGSA